MCRRLVCLVALFLALGLILTSAEAESVGWWMFDEGVGNIASDSSGNEHHADVLGTPEWVDGPPGFVGALDFRNTRGANAGDFDPTNGKGVFTLTFWCNWDGTGGIQHFFTKSNGWGADTMMFQVEVKGGHSNPDRVNRFHLAYQGASQAVLHVVPANEWAHMAMVFDGTNAIGYLNGVDESGPQPTGIGTPVAGPVWIGVAHNDQRVFQGMIDDMRLYDRVLSEDEVIAVMAGETVEQVDPEESLIVPKTSVAPVIDGELDGVWHNVGEARCLITDIVNSDSAAPEDWYDLFGTFKTMYDADHFYIFVQVQDSVLDYEFSNWNGDGVEIFFDGDNSKGETYDGINDNQIRITVDDVNLPDIDSSLPVEGAAFKVLLTDLGYNVEAAFPLAALQIDSTADTVIGFEVQINDNDGVGGRETLIRWHSNDNNSWQNASLFGEAKLVTRAVSETLDVVKVEAAPVIDGVMEAAWNDLPEITGNKYVLPQSDLTKQNDYTDSRFSMRTGWDDQNIYFFVSVLDDIYYDLTTDHQSDGVELFFDADNSKTFEAYDQVDDVQLRINHADLTPADIDISGGVRAPANVIKDNISFAVVNTDVGYDMEIAIPLVDLALPAEAGHVFGFDLFLNDADEDVRDSIRNYWSGNNDNWRYAHLFGEAVLTGSEEAIGLVAHWKFDDGAGNTATDSVGNAHPGTIGGTANWVAGQVGGALDFDGSTNYVDIGGVQPVISGTFSLAMWIYARDIPTAAGDLRMPLSNDTWADRAIHVHIWPETAVFRIDTKNGTDISSNTALQADQWYHVAGTLDAAGESKIYINGVLDNSATGNGREYIIGPANIGAYQESSRFFNGMIDDIRIYNRILSDVEIQEIVNQ